MHFGLNQTWQEWTGFESQTLWDLLELLIVPVFIALGVALMSQLRKNSELEIETDRARERALQRYLDHITELLLEKSLHSSEKGSPVRQIARARTLTVLAELDGRRKGIIIRFLYQSNLIKKDSPIIDLSGADLDEVDLSGNDESENRDKTFLSYLSLSDIQLAGVNLRKANLREAKLSGANLLMTDLRKADLRDSHLMLTDMRFATLTGAKLGNANLMKADLSGAKGVSKKQLRRAKSFIGAILPKAD
jgi:uncharacterized protein YjbI with pentapeptide repeats